MFGLICVGTTFPFVVTDSKLIAILTSIIVRSQQLVAAAEVNINLMPTSNKILR
jgi:hypothetical protein